MFFWFLIDSFSWIDALAKLILVITGSTLIICFCHRLTKNKKSNTRYKSYSTTASHLIDPNNCYYQPSQTLTTTYSPPLNCPIAHHYLNLLNQPYDPYNIPPINDPLSLTAVSNQRIRPDGAGWFDLIANRWRRPSEEPQVRTDINLDQPLSTTAGEYQPSGDPLPANAGQAETEEPCPSYEEAVSAANQCQPEVDGPEEEHERSRVEDGVLEAEAEAESEPVDT